MLVFQADLKEQTGGEENMAWDIVRDLEVVTGAGLASIRVKGIVILIKLMETVSVPDRS